MADIQDDTGMECDIIALSFAARLLLTNLDRELIAERAVESLADFGKSSRVGLFLLNEEGRLVCSGGFVNGVPQKRSFVVDLPDDLHKQLIIEKNSGTFPLAYADDIPIPARTGLPGRMCMGAPLVAANNQVIGIATFDHPVGFSLTPMMLQALSLILTIVAIAMETARLFQSAVYDGLTELYIRHYFDLRLAEEESRIKRYGGKLAIVILDIDHFKRVNDNYGHQQGDVVLREIAGIIRSAVRQDVDSPCRYGGEEFVIIMPDTNLGGALIVAERIRHRIQKHIFPMPDGPFQVTVSGGVAFMDQENFVTRQELLKKADEALYRAKGEGRNQIQVWAEKRESSVLSTHG